MDADTLIAETSDPAGSGMAEATLARENWERYEYGRDRGHNAYCRRAKRLEDYYLGGGCQWSEADKLILAEQERMPLEFNEILPGINAAIGYQISNRLDISFEPRGGRSNQDTATALNKVTMQVADNIKLHWKETEVFSDGVIQQRGYFEIRISFNDSMRGEIELSVPDPMDVIPDPDAKSYDPDDWADVVISRWLSFDEIEGRYGKDARMKAELFAGRNTDTSDADHGDQDGDGTARNKFGDENYGPTGIADAVKGDKHMRKVRLVDRQKFVYELCNVMVFPDTGDVRVVDGLEPEKVAAMAARGGIPSKRMAKRVKWLVTTYETVLFDSYSPYDFFTIVPFFPYFRRGRTRGMVDNAMGPQDALNKAGSQFIHILNTQANSGWTVEEGSLVNMTTEDLQENGGKNGLVVEYKKGAQAPKKIEAAQIPTGIDRLIDRLTVFLKSQTTPDALRGVDEATSGLERKEKSFAAQQQLAVVLDNLNRTRDKLANRILRLIQTYYDDARVFRITKKDPVTGIPTTEELAINTPDPATGEVLNDLTLGEYGVIVNSRPTQVSFESGEFDQAMKMREQGVRIPDDVVIRSSALADKEEVLQRMAQQQEQQPDPLTQAKVALTQAQTAKAMAETTSKKVETQFSAINTAQVIATTPATAPLADSLLKSAGYEDMDAPPIVPSPPPGMGPGLPLPENTNPLTPLNPTNPAVGIGAGIEAGLPA